MRLTRRRLQHRDRGLRALRLRGLWLVVLVSVGGAGAPAVNAETGWISDVFTVPLRSGPSNGHRIVHRGLPSGTPFEVLGRDDDAGFVQIRTPSGTEGWIEVQYVTNEPIAKERLERATARVSQLEQRLAEINSNLKEVRTASDQSSNENDGLSRNVAALEVELAELKRVAASAIQTNDQKQELAALNERLRSEVDELVSDNQRLAGNAQQRWMLIGAGLALAGLVAGVALKTRPRRSGWS